MGRNIKTRDGIYATDVLYLQRLGNGVLGDHEMTLEERAQVSNALNLASNVLHNVHIRTTLKRQEHTGPKQKIR